MSLFAKPEDITRETGSVPLSSALKNGPSKFWYQGLTDRNFELLLYSLCGESPLDGVDHDGVQLLNVGADKGRDLVLYRGQKPIGAVQCKRHDDVITLPVVLQELVKFLLFAQIHPEILPDPDDFTYVLAVSKHINNDAQDLFNAPSRIILENDKNIDSYVKKTIKKFASFGGLDAETQSAEVKNLLARIKYRYLYSETLDIWLEQCHRTQASFFDVRLVLDYAAVQKISTDIHAALADLKQKLEWIKPGNRAGSKLIKWIGISMSSAADASRVSLGGSGSNATSIGMASVYVKRDIEEEVLDRIRGSDACPASRLIALVAPGGNGKTSLMWRIFTNLQAGVDYIPLFFSAANLGSYFEGSDTREELDSLYEEIGEAVVAGKRIVALFDTVDVLSHTQETRSATINAINALVSCGASVVLSTRPDSVDELQLETIDNSCVRITVEKYSDRELKDACKLYSVAFGKLRTEENPGGFAGVIPDSGPVKELCTGPLTLKLIFELDALDLLSDSAGSEELFSVFWIEKVIRDKRSGHDARNANLGETIKQIASHMYRTGKPFISRFELNWLFSREYLEQRQVQAALSRGLLVTTQPDFTVSFFHQTFFEYSASRALTDGKTPSEVKDVVDFAVEHYSDDAFRLAVIEHLLISQSDQPVGAPAWLDDVALQLIESTRPGLNMCCFGAHATSRNGFAAVRNLILTAITESDRTVYKRWMEVLPRVGSHRIIEIENQLLALAREKDWPFVDLMSHAWKWFAQRQPEQCWAALQRTKYLETLFEVAPDNASVERTAVSILTPCLTIQSDGVLEFFETHRRNQSFSTAVLDMISENVSTFKPAVDGTAVSGFYQTLLKHGVSGRDRACRRSLARCIAALWEIDNTLAPTEVSTVFHDCKTDHYGPMLALIHRSRTDLGISISDIETHVKKCSDLAELYTWRKSYLLPAMDPDNSVLPSIRDAAGQFIASEMERLIDDTDNATKLKSREKKVLSRFICDAYAENCPLPGLTAILKKIPPDQWLTDHSLADLFPVALIEEIDGAILSFASLMEQPQKHKRTIEVLSAALPKMKLSGHTVKAIIEMCDVMDDPIALVNLVQTGRHEDLALAHSILHKNSPTLLALIRRLVKSNREGIRLNAYRAYTGLITANVLPAALAVDTVQWVKNEKAAGARLHALELWSVSAGSDMGAVLAESYRLAKGMPVNQTIQQLDLLLTAQPMSVDLKLLAEITKFAVSGGESEPRARLVGRVIALLCARGEIESAHSATLTLFRSEHVRNELSPTQKRTLGHRLDKPIKALFSLLSTVQLAEYADLLEDIDIHLGRTIVVGLCKCNAPSAQTVRENVSSNVRLDRSYSKIIYDYRKYVS